MAEKEKDELEKMNEALSMSEQFVEKYQKPLLWGLLIGCASLLPVAPRRQGTSRNVSGCDGV